LIGRFWDRRCDADLLNGSREHRLSRRIGEPPVRHIAGRLFNLLAWTIAPGYADTQCGYKLFTARAAQEIFSRARITGWAFDVETLYLAGRLGLRVADVEIDWYYNADSRVRLLGDAYCMALEIWRIRRYAARRAYDVHAVKPVVKFIYPLSRD
jgi:dolichyl-phosphate beta-glucosyltransferase